VKRNFPSFLDAFMEYNKNLGVSQKFLLWSAISGVAACLERKVWIKRGSYPNMFVMLIAGPGVGKSRASGEIVSLLKEVDGIADMSTQLSGASLVKQLAEAGNKKQFTWEGVTFKNSSLFSYSSEASSTIGDARALSGVKELLTDFYDCRDWSTKHSWNKETLSGGNVPIHNHCLNLLYCSTPNWLMTSLGRSGIAGGFASRIIFVYEKQKPDAPQWIDDESDLPENKSFRKKLVQDLTAISKLQGKFTLSDGFKVVYNNVARDASVKEKEDPEGLMAPYYNRKPFHFQKLCMVLSAQESDSLHITQEHAMAAADLLASLEPEMYEPFGVQGDNKNLPAMNKTWNALREREFWTEQAIIDRCYRHATIKDIKEFLKVFMNKKKMRAYPIKGGVAYQVTDPSPLSATSF
jgi:hypothetical protein